MTEKNQTALVFEGNSFKYEMENVTKLFFPLRHFAFRYDGVCLTSWVQVDGTWYYMDANGYMETGWIKYKDNWYYLDPSTGAMRTNCTVDGYKLNADGIRV